MDDKIKDGEFDELEAMDRYQSIIQEVLAGRMDGHKCPYCGQGELEIMFDGSKMRIQCPNCGRFFEGMLA
jgi:ribosomal protein S27E